MTVVAGCLLFDGVILMADSRGTISRPGRPDIRMDVVQKLVPLTPTMTLGFAGNIPAAGELLRHALNKLERRPRKDAVSLLHWIPRLFRHEFCRLPKALQRYPVELLGGAIILDQPNYVERSVVAELVNRIGFGKSPVKRN